MADITIVNGVYKPTNITGGHHPVAMVWKNHKNITPTELFFNMILREVS